MSGGVRDVWTARFLWAMTAVLSGMVVVSAVEMINGNDTAVNGVVGASIGVLIFGCLAALAQKGKI